MLDNRRVILRLQIIAIPTRHELDGVFRTCAAAGLAERAVEPPRGEILFDGVKGAELHALAAANA